MDFPSHDEIFTGITWSRMVFFLVGSVMVVYCTMLLDSVEFGCSPFPGVGVFLGGCPASQVWFPPLVSAVSVLGGLWRSLWCRLSLPHGQSLWDSHLPLWCPCLIQTWHNLWRFTISQQLWRSLFCNSGHEASSCDPEQHKQFYTPGGGLLCLSPVPSLLPVSFVVTSVTKDDVRLGFGESFVPFGGFFLFALVSVVVISTAPANPGSFLIAACFTNLARSSRPGFFPFSLMEYDTSAPCWSSSRAVYQRLTSYSQ